MTAARTEPAAPPPSYVVVIPTLGRPCLQACLDALADAHGPLPRQIVLADDRPDTPDPLPVLVPAAIADRTVIVTLEGRGPAAARNAGWRAAKPAEWVAFLDDDVRVGPRWRAELMADLTGQPAHVAGVQGVIEVPLPPDRRPTDWERGTAGLASSRWITADMAYRRSALIAVGGFDERFPRAFREDADLALRLLDRGWDLRAGDRTTTHPVRPASRWASLKAQAGNADDALMRRLHGRGWHRRAAAAPGRRRGHLVTSALLASAALAWGASSVTAGPYRAGLRRAALAAGAGWLASTAEFTAARVLPGPRTRHEIATMAVTSVLIPPLAVGHWLRGQIRHRRVSAVAAGARCGAVRPGRHPDPRRALQRPPRTGGGHARGGGCRCPAAVGGHPPRRRHQPVRRGAWADHRGADGGGEPAGGRAARAVRRVGRLPP